VGRTQDGVRIRRVFAVIDCGTVVSASGAEAQAQGGVLDGLSAALFGEVTFTDGVADQKNFNAYRMLRMREVPPVDVHFIPSQEAPSGLGEIAVPPAAPALANAIFALTGRRLRRLPLFKALSTL
jgi:isoquinoline 1-oxidoreductase subunit beta